MISLPKDKSAWRQMSRTNRRKISCEIGSGVGDDIAEHLISEIDVSTNTAVAGYWPMRNEANVLPTLMKLHEKGCPCLLPTAVERHSSLIFRAWNPGDEMRTSSFGVQEPTFEKPVKIPDMVLVPLLAFDTNGHRLGYGGGYYDWTIAELRNDAGENGVWVVGIAFSGQQVDVLPSEAHDQQLDMVVTETGVVRFN